MDINIRSVSGVTVVALSGELTAKTAPAVQERILEEAKPGCKMIVDMNGVTYMSSGGLRMMLKIYRTASSQGGRVLLVGLSEDVKATMAVTGFLDFFKHYDHLEAGLTELTS